MTNSPSIKKHCHFTRYLSKLHRLSYLSLLIPLLLCGTSQLEALASEPTLTVMNAIVSPNPAGEIVTLSASVWAGSTPVTIGFVTFKDGAANLGTAQLQADGSATLRTFLSPGVHSIRAAFLGSNAGAPSLSSARAVIQQGTATAQLSSTGSNGTYKLEVVVTSPTGQAPGGTVEFFDKTSNRSLRSTPLWPARAPVRLDPKFTVSLGFFSYGSTTVTADINEDGIADLITFGAQQVEAPSAYITVLLGNHSGPPTAVTSIPFLSNTEIADITTGDFDGDGHLDLMLYDKNNKDLWLILGDGTGHFTQSSYFGSLTNGNGFYAGDFNGDGFLDLLVDRHLGGRYGDVPQTYLGSGYKGKAATPGPSSSIPIAAPYTVGDFNGDGIPDIIGPSNSRMLTFDYALALGDGYGGFVLQPQSIFDMEIPRSNSVASADFNDDGNLDLAVYDDRTGLVYTLLGDGSGHFAKASSAPLVASGAGIPGVIQATDLNGDGKVDLVLNLQIIPPGALSDAVMSQRTALGAGDGSFTLQNHKNSMPMFTNNFNVGDFNGDGFPDTALYNARYDLVYDLSNPEAVSTTKADVLLTGVGIHTITANYSGGDGLPAITTNTLSLAAIKLNTTTTLVTSKNPIEVGSTVKLTANVLPAAASAPPIAGVVDFYDGSLLLGTAPVSADKQNAKLSVSGLSAGVHFIRAVYVGDSDFNSSTSADLAQTVTP